MGRSLLIFSDVTFKKAAWGPYWIFRLSCPSFILSLSIMSKLQWHITCEHRKAPIDFQQCHFQNGLLAAILVFQVSGLYGFCSVTQACFRISISYFICMLFVSMGRSLLILRVVSFKIAAWRPYSIFRFQTLNYCLALNIKFNFSNTLLVCVERSLLTFSNVTFKMAAWGPYWICLVSGLYLQAGFEFQIKTSAAHFLRVWVDRRLVILQDAQLQSTYWPLIPISAGWGYPCRSLIYSL